MKFRIYFHSIFIDESLATFVVALALDALHFREQLANQLAHLGIVVDLYVGLAVFLNELHHLILLSLLENPGCDELTVAHVSLLNVLTRFDAVELGHEAIKHILVVFCLVSLGIVKDAEFLKFRICEVIEREKVGACLLKSRAVFLERIGIDTRHQLTGSVTKTLVEVGVKHIGDIEIVFKQLTGRRVDHELLIETVAVRCHVVGLGDILDCHRLRTVLSANPVGVRKVDTDSCAREGIACEHRSVDNLGRHTLHFRFAIFRIDRRVIFKPLSVARYGLRAI